MLYGFQKEVCDTGTFQDVAWDTEEGREDGEPVEPVDWFVVV